MRNAGIPDIMDMNSTKKIRCRMRASRDLLKNHIMEMYGIPLLRFKTNGSGEKEKNIEVLEKVAV